MASAMPRMRERKSACISSSGRPRVKSAETVPSIFTVSASHGGTDTESKSGELTLPHTSCRLITAVPALR